MASQKVVFVLALLFLLQCHWAQCQFFGPYGGFGFPGPYGGNRDDDDWEILLPILLLTLCGRGEFGGGYGGFGGGYGAPVPLPYGGGGCGCGCNRC